MKVVDPGHVYDLNWLDGEPSKDWGPHWPNRLIFVKREGEGYPGNVGSHPGTTMQDVIRALIERLRYVNNQVPHWANTTAIAHLQEVIYDLEYRAAERHGREEEFISQFNWYGGIESVPTCSDCGHIGCNNTCHKGPYAIYDHFPVLPG